MATLFRNAVLLALALAALPESSPEEPQEKAKGTPDKPLPPAAGRPEGKPQDGGGSQAKSESGAEALARILAGMGVRYDAEKRKIEVDGWVNLEKGLIEVFACAPEGKTHEAVVVLDCVPSAVHAGLLALGLEPGKPVETGTEADYKMPTGDPVEITVSWRDKEGKERTARAEEWVWNSKEERPMKNAPWIYAGSFMQAVSGDPEDATYAANYVKSIVTTYHDPSSILENPFPEGRDDTIYYVNEKAVPPAGTPIRVAFSRAEKAR